MESAEPKPVGTVVTLELRRAFRGLLDLAVLGDTLTRYRALLSRRVFLGDAASALNDVPAPWPATTPPTSRSRPQAQARIRRALRAALSADLHAGHAPEPSHPVTRLLRVQDSATYATSDDHNLSVFVRGILLDDDARDCCRCGRGSSAGLSKQAA